MSLLRSLATLFVAALISLANAQAAERVTIAAAADLKFAMDEIATAFRKAHPGSEVELIYGSSGKFHTQLQHDAPFDLFFSADIGFARDLRATGEAISEPKLYAIGRIVLWSPTRDASKMTLAVLTDPAIKKIAIANPKHAPYGKRAEEALRSAGLWETLQDKLVFGENIAHTAQYVQSGAADIGIIALSLAVNKELSSKGGYALIPAEKHEPLEQAYVITKHGRGNALASDFAAYMDTPDARRIMTQYGFVLPGENVAN
ncbi:MAG: molybdate ABC transporter substrate-binding protein [Hyphomicrobium sp.]|jgi:molybdate transport system substrate-binding protein